MVATRSTERSFVCTSVAGRGGRLEGSMVTLIGLLVTVYTSIITLFALLYMWVDGEGSACGLADHNTTLAFHTAFAFSVETMTTIGYGIPYDTAAFFSGCVSLTLVVYTQSLVFILLNAALLGIIFARVDDTRYHIIVTHDSRIIFLLHS